MIYRDLLAKATKKENGCIEWNGTKTVKGYGVLLKKKLGSKYKLYKVHRIVWEMFHGDIPDDLMVCHHCDNPKCINIKHLFIGTAKDNFYDAVKKGRIPATGNLSYSPLVGPDPLLPGLLFW